MTNEQNSKSLQEAGVEVLKDGLTATASSGTFLNIFVNYQSALADLQSDINEAVGNGKKETIRLCNVRNSLTINRSIKALNISDCLFENIRSHVFSAIGCNNILIRRNKLRHYYRRGVSCKVEEQSVAVPISMKYWLHAANLPEFIMSHIRYAVL